MCTVSPYILNIFLASTVNLVAIKEVLVGWLVSLFSRTELFRGWFITSGIIKRDRIGHLL